MSPAPPPSPSRSRRAPPSGGAHGGVGQLPGQSLQGALALLPVVAAVDVHPDIVPFPAVGHQAAEVRRDDRRGGPRSPRVEGAGEVPKAPRPKLDDGPAPERVYTPKAEPVAPAPKLVEFTQEEREAAEKTSLYGKIEL